MLPPAALAAAALPLAASAAPATVEVTAQGETVPVGTAAADAADDPAIWRNPRRPARSLIVATDKKAGLYLYGLDGKPRDFSPDGRLNTVDLIGMGRRGVIVVAGDYFFYGLEEDWAHQHHCLRLSYTQPAAQVAQGIRVIGELLRSLF
jgi:3-phytase